jgi:Inner membrane component of T3SS, cytoplasmic domain
MRSTGQLFMASRVYFNAVFGGLGGLIGWMLFGILGDRAAPADRVTAQLALGGALIGGSIGFFLTGSDALRDRSALRFFRAGTYGLLLGAAGGALGMVVGDVVHHRLIELRGTGRPGDWSTLLGAMQARGFGWVLLGVAVGFSEGLAARSFGKMSYGMVGGALGGFIGGALFGLAVEATRGREVQGPLWGALGLVILGAMIGSLSALVQAAFEPASVRVVRGWQEGREYSLARSDNLLGRDEHADVALFRDMRIEKRHAVIRRRGKRYVLENRDAPAAQTRVNGDPVSRSCDLRDGDRIELGGVVLRFQLRAARARRTV